MSKGPKFDTPEQGPVDTFPPTAAGVRQWAKSTDPKPDPAAVVRYARQNLTRAEQLKLVKDYPALRPVAKAA